MEIKPIAYISNNYNNKFGIPRQSGRANNLSTIYFYSEYNNPDAIRGLNEFSHIWLIFDFSLSHKESYSPTVRPPRLGGNKKVGVFASRSPFRPNSLGLSCVKLLSIENINNKIELKVLGADLLNGTPIYDIKPYISFSDCIEDAKCGYAEQNKNHKLEICDKNNLLSIFGDKKSEVRSMISDDPRPSYQDDNREYKMLYCNFDIVFNVEKNKAIIKEIKIKNEGQG